jgi:hypothetical protein
VQLHPQLMLLQRTETATTEESAFSTSCDPFSQGFSEGPSGPSFFI